MATRLPREYSARDLALFSEATEPQLVTIVQRATEEINQGILDFFAEYYELLKVRSWRTAFRLAFARNLREVYDRNEDAGATDTAAQERILEILEEVVNLPEYSLKRSDIE